MHYRLVTGLVMAMFGASTALAADLLDDLLAVPGSSADSIQTFGFVEGAAARTYAGTDHWSKLRLRVEAGASGSLGEGVRWRFLGRADADHAYVIEDDIYPLDVRRDQRSGASIREAYLDVPAGSWELRLGRQQIVWGEMVGLFFADVVSARDMREFVLPDFDQMRIPQWAARAEYFGEDDFHGEVLWVPVATVDDIGEPGADFYAFRPDLPVPARIRDQETPPSRLGHGNFGLRAGKLVAGWDMTGFYYNSVDVAPTYYFDPTDFSFTPRHDRIQQLGATVSKDLGSMVLKAEAVYTDGRKFNTRRVGAEDGLYESDTLDYAVGLDLPFDSGLRINTQVFGRRSLALDSGAVVDANEAGGTVLVSQEFGDALEAEVLVVTGFNRGDYMVRPKLTWTPDGNWRLRAGIDAFGGDEGGLFGRFDTSDRLYLEARRSF
ncbi:MAG: hypothetical protein KDG55_03810 [Rhodocyclaceae bacterium]|nr:hypothetical protein [Rhodocyclaceae bacterium]